MLKLRFLYHLRKPRVISQIDNSYKSYQKTLKQARKAIHIESMQYLQKIEDGYLSRHQDLMKSKHFEYQCSFRKQIFTDAFRLHQNQLKWKKRDDHYTSTLNKVLHQQDVRKINRSRILKIMEHESNNYWFNSQNVETRLKQETIFPQYIASSEYYYKLFAEALAYQLGDFFQLHMVSSNEEIIREKNKYLIPIYMNLRSKIMNYKRDQVKEARQKASFQSNLIRSNANLTPQEVQELEKKVNESLEAKIKEIQTKNALGGKDAQLKLRIKDIISIFNSWKEYTNILALTSAQILKNRSDVYGEIQINKAEKEILKNLTSRMNDTFIDSIEEDTQEIEMSFEEYLAKVNQQRKDKQVAPSGSASMEELDNLLNSVETKEVNETQSSNKNAQKQLDLSSLTKDASLGMPASEMQISEQLVNPLFLSPKETTASVQILKEQFKDDKQMLVLLNQLGEIDVRYPKLFQTIWQSSH